MTDKAKELGSQSYFPTAAPTIDPYGVDSYGADGITIRQAIMKGAFEALLSNSAIAGITYAVLAEHAISATDALLEAMVEDSE